MTFETRVHARCGCGLAASSEEEAHLGGASGRPFALSTSTRHFERDRPFAIEHLALDVTLDFENKRVDGKATLRFRRVDPDSTEMVLDAIGFEVERVALHGKEIACQNDGKTLRIAIPAGLAEGSLEVRYAATPRRGLYFLEPDEHVTDRPRQAWTQCQEEDARHFVPCHDKPHVKMTTEMRVAVPNGFTVLSNGALVSKDTPVHGPWRFHWRMDSPHPSYLLTLVAGEFAEIADDADGVPVTYLVPKDRAADVPRTFGRTPAMIRYFGELLGVKYPWNKYAQVVVSDFIFGGMENTTATTLYEYTLLDERASLDVTSDDLIAHELAHQWFGDYVTCRDWSEGWLNEGFATFMEHVWREKDLGRDEYDFGIRSDLDAYAGEAHGRYRRPIVCQLYDAPLDLFDRHLYEKGGLVLHVLRTELGDALFWRGISAYLKGHAHGIVETRDLLRALEEVSGRSLGKIFDQFVYRPGHPEIELTLTWEKGVLGLASKQTHAHTDEVPAVFEVSFFLEIVLADGTLRRERVALTARSETFALPCAERPAYVVVDPEMRILGEVSVRAPDDLLHAQLERAKTARGRWLAALALARSDTPRTIAALATCLARDDEFWGVRAAAAESLGKLRGREPERILARSVDVAHPKVRRAVIAALGAFRTTAAAEALRPKALKDPSYLVEAEAARSLGRTRQASAFDTLVDLLERPSWADVIRGAAIDGLAALRDDRATPHLLARTRYGHPTRARRAAIGAIPKLMSDRRGRETLEELLDDADPHLRIDVVRALGEYGDAKARPALRARLDVDLDPRVRRRLRETLRDLGGEGRRAVEHVRDELEKLQTEHAEIKTKLAALAARFEVEPEGKASPPATAKKPGKPAASGKAARAGKPARAARSGKKGGSR
jgi:aminopeptidase N